MGLTVTRKDLTSDAALVAFGVAQYRLRNGYRIGLAEGIRVAKQPNGLADLIIRDVSEIERDPLPGQADDEMRVTPEELRAILESHLQ